MKFNSAYAVEVHKPGRRRPVKTEFAKLENAVDYAKACAAYGWLATVWSAGGEMMTFKPESK